MDAETLYNKVIEYSQQKHGNNSSDYLYLLVLQKFNNNDLINNFIKNGS